jgi:PHD/YefM family antitoxin component YafN of YafNO toxin-antitoxin module
MEYDDPQKELADEAEKEAADMAEKIEKAQKDLVLKGNNRTNRGAEGKRRAGRSISFKKTPQ